MSKRSLSYYLDQLPILLVLLATSFCSICIEVIGIYTFSIKVGYIYFHVSLLTSVLLLSAAASCFAAYRFSDKAKAGRLIIVSEVVLLIMLFVFLFLREVFLGSMASFYILLIVTGAVLGAQFSFVTSLILKDDAIKTDAGYIYAVDLMGAGLFLFVFLRFMPLFGIGSILYSALFIKAVSLALFYTHMSKVSTRDEAEELEAAEAKEVTPEDEALAAIKRILAEDAKARRRSILHIIIPFVYGMSVIVTQSLLIRMMLVNVGHTYISFGLPIGLWLIGAAAGSYSAGFLEAFKRPGVSLTMIVLAAFLVPTAVFVFLYYGLEFQSVAFNLTFFVALIFVVSFVSGMIFPLICHYFNEKSYVQLIYVIEGAGAFLGGLLFAFYNFSFSDFTLSVMASILLITLVLLLCVFNKNRFAFIIAGISLVLISLVYSSHDTLDTKWMYNQQIVRNENILFYQYTKNGRVEVVQENATKNVAVYIDRVLQYSLADDKIHNESMAVISYYLTESPVNALVIGGGVGGLARELLELDLERIDYIEIEPEFKNIRKHYFSDMIGDITDNDVLNLVNADGFKYLKETTESYDIIILDIPSPSTPQLSRFFTREFFRLVKSKLSANGTFMLPLMDSLTFPNERYINYSIHNTLDEEFALKRVFLPLYYIPKVRNPRNESDFIKKPYFELVVCSESAQIKEMNDQKFYDLIKDEAHYKESPYGQPQYVSLLFSASDAYYDEVYAEYDFKGISTLDKMLSLHLKWKHSNEKMNPAVNIVLGADGKVTISTGR